MTVDTDELDAKLQTLRNNATRWARLDVAHKARMVDRLAERMRDVADQLVDASMRSKDISPGGMAEGEVWFSGPLPVMRTLRFLRKTLRGIVEDGRPPIPDEAVHERRDTDTSQAIVDVLPYDRWDRAIYPGFEASVWMQPEVEARAIDEAVAGFYRRPDPEGVLHLILTLGNVASIPPLDALDKLVHEGHVGLLHLNPYDAPLAAPLERAFAEFIDEGFLQIVCGDVDVGTYLVQHEQVDQIHLTGSDRTHDAIAYGLGEEGEDRKRRDEPRTDMRITSAVGNIAPVIVAPGPWSDDALDYHAENIATQVVNNAGFNCNAARLLITPAGWEGRRPLMDAIRRKLRAIPQRVAYYPGAHKRFDAFMTYYDQAEQIGRRTDDVLPWGLIPDVDPADRASPAFCMEPFCGLLSETALEAPGLGYFLARAVDFCNERVWGNLNASIIIHPDTAGAHGELLERAIADLEYGTVGINQWPAIAYGLGVTPWGAWPGNSWQNLQSGIGFTHNAFLFDKPRKTVLRGPFRTRIKPPWFASHNRAHRLAPRLVDFEYAPSMGPLARILWQEVRG